MEMKRKEGQEGIAQSTPSPTEQLRTTANATHLPFPAFPAHLCAGAVTTAVSPYPLWVLL